MAPRLGYCWPCTDQGRRFVEAVFMLNDDPHCATCFRAAGGIPPAIPEAPAVPTPAAVVRNSIATAGQQRSTPQPDVCARGCGRAPHRGRCRTGIAPPAPKSPQPTPKEKTVLAMDNLVCNEVNDADVPAAAVTPHALGRLGKLWLRLLDLPAGKWLKVENRDRLHAMNTARHAQMKAKKTGRKLERRIHGSDLYVRLEAL